METLLANKNPRNIKNNGCSFIHNLRHTMGLYSTRLSSILLNLTVVLLTRTKNGLKNSPEKIHTVIWCGYTFELNVPPVLNWECFILSSSHSNGILWWNYYTVQRQRKEWSKHQSVEVRVRAILPPKHLLQLKVTDVNANHWLELSPSPTIESPRGYLWKSLPKDSVASALNSKSQAKPLSRLLGCYKLYILTLLQRLSHLGRKLPQATDLPLHESVSKMCHIYIWLLLHFYCCGGCLLGGIFDLRWGKKTSLVLGVVWLD